jgi:hypothetical protein
LHSPRYSINSFLIYAFLATCADLYSCAEIVELHKSCELTPELARIPVPRYSVAVREHDTTGVLDLQISIASEQATEGPLVRLACQLASDFSNERSIHALVFDDKEAARRLALHHTDQPKHGIYLWHLRARYELRRDRNEHFIEFVSPEVQDDLLNVRRFKVWIDPR